MIPSSVPGAWHATVCLTASFPTLQPAQKCCTVMARCDLKHLGSRKSCFLSTGKTGDIPIPTPVPSPAQDPPDSSSGSLLPHLPVRRQKDLTQIFHQTPLIPSLARSGWGRQEPQQPRRSSGTGCAHPAGLEAPRAGPGRLGQGRNTGKALARPGKAGQPASSP